MLKILPGGKASAAPNSQHASPVQKFHPSSAGERQPHPPKSLGFYSTGNTFISLWQLRARLCGNESMGKTLSPSEIPLACQSCLLW